MSETWICNGIYWIRSYNRKGTCTIFRYSSGYYWKVNLYQDPTVERNNLSPIIEEGVSTTLEEAQDTCDEIMDLVEAV